MVATPPKTAVPPAQKTVPIRKFEITDDDDDVETEVSFKPITKMAAPTAPVKVQENEATPEREHEPRSPPQQQDLEDDEEDSEISFAPKLQNMKMKGEV